MISSWIFNFTSRLCLSAKKSANKIFLSAYYGQDRSHSSLLTKLHSLEKEAEGFVQGHPEKQAAPPLLNQIICQIFVINTLREGVRKKSEGFIPLEISRQRNWFLTEVLMDKRQKLVCKFSFHFVERGLKIERNSI